MRAPERIERLVLASTAPYAGPPERWQGRIDLVRRGGMAAVADATVERWLTPAFWARAPGAAAALRDGLLSTPPERYAGCCAAIRDMDLRPTAPLIAPPVLLVAGPHDPTTPPERAEEIAAALRAGGRPGARVVRLDAAHVANVEPPGTFAGAVLDFLA